MKNDLTYPEWMVMSALWGRQPQTLSQVIEGMEGKMNWSYKTYATYLRNLCEKGMVGFEARGRDKYYYALVPRQDCIRAESKSLLKKVSQKGIKEMVVCMIEEGGLSQKDYEELKEMLSALAREERQ